LKDDTKTAKAVFFFDLNDDRHPQE